MAPRDSEIDAAEERGREKGRLETGLESLKAIVEKQAQNIEQLFNLMRTCKQENCDRIEITDRKVDRLIWKIATYGTIAAAVLAIIGPPLGEKIFGSLFGK